MQKRWLIFTVAVLLTTGRPALALVAKPGDVLINEIAWMGTTDSSTHEWIELKNATDMPIDLSGWVLRTADKKITVPLQGQITAHGFYLLERTSDDTVPTVTADIIYKGTLSNKGQDLGLYDNHSTTIDEVNFTAAWPAGDNKTKQTMERATDGSWQTSIAINGTPKAENDVSRAIATATPSPMPSPSISYPTGIIISELLPAPTGPAATDEWIEVFNKDNTAADISNWIVQDTQGTAKTYAIPKNTVIQANGYLVLKRPDTGIVLNDQADGVQLLNPGNMVIDAVSYQKAPRGESYALIGNSWQWSSNPTPGSKNNSGITAGRGLPSNKKTDNTEGASVAAAAAAAPEILFSSQDTRRNPDPWFLVLAIGTAIILAGSTLLIIAYKKKYKNL